MSVDPVGIVEVAARATARRPGEHVVGRVPGPLAWAVGRRLVWDCLRAGGITGGCPNVMLYLHDTPRVEGGVLLRRWWPFTGRVVPSTVPSGRAATTLHRGRSPVSAHDAVLRWCHEHSLTVTPTRWEVYGPHREDPEQQRTQVDWLLA